jgi:hypothetical protein
MPEPAANVDMHALFADIDLHGHPRLGRLRKQGNNDKQEN